MQKLRVAVVGCGFVAPSHLKCLHRLEQVEIVAVADPDRDAAERTARDFAVPQVYADTGSLLEGSRPDVVHLLTPTQTHLELALEIMRHGCDLVLEKPMASTASEAEAILSAAREHGTKLTVCHNFLFMPCIATALDMLTDGKLGELVGVDIAWRPPLRGFHVGWTQELPGGALHEILPHAIYLQRAFVGEVRAIAGVTRRGGAARGPDCEIRVLMDAEQGTSQVEVSPSGEPKQFLMRVEGTKMSLHIDIGANTLVRVRKLGDGKLAKAAMNVDQAVQLLTATVFNAFSLLRGGAVDGHFPLIRAYYRALRDGSAPPVTGEDGCATADILDRIWATPSAA